METKNYRHLWMGTLAAALILLITSYLYYNVVSDVQLNSSDWLYKILYSLVLGFIISYLCWKAKRIGGSHWLTGFVIGLLSGMLIIVAGRLVSFQSNGVIICCDGSDCWIWIVMTIMGAMAAVAASDGKTGGGSDD